MTLFGVLLILAKRNTLTRQTSNVKICYFQNFRMHVIHVKVARDSQGSSLYVPKECDSYLTVCDQSSMEATGPFSQDSSAISIQYQLAHEDLKGNNIFTWCTFSKQYFEYLYIKKMWVFHDKSTRNSKKQKKNNILAFISEKLR